MKKLNIFKTLLLLAAILMPQGLMANSFIVDGLRYVFNEGHHSVSVASINGNCTGDIVIPSSIFYEREFYPVISICSWGFSGCSGMTSVTIPNSVTSFGSFAFENCSGLTSVTMPNSITFIGPDAFSGCSGLTSVHISNLASWCGFPFTNITSNPLSYAHHLYLNGIEIKDLVIPNSVSYIRPLAFYNCSGLTSVTIPNSVTTIESLTFYGCDGMTSVSIPNSVTTIGGGAFEGCSGLKSVVIPNSVIEIGGDAFRGCSGLTSVVIPNSVIEIGGDAFRGCSGLTSVTCFSTTPPFVGNYAFYNNNGKIEKLYVPASAVDAYNASIWKDSFVEILSLDNIRGDIDGSYIVDVSDLELLIDVVLGKRSADDLLGDCHVLGNESIDVADVAALIDIILGK